MTNKVLFFNCEPNSIIKEYLTAETYSLDFSNLLCASLTSARVIWGTNIFISLTRQLIQSNVRKLDDMLKEICPVLIKGALGAGE